MTYSAIPIPLWRPPGPTGKVLPAFRPKRLKFAALVEEGTAPANMAAQPTGTPPEWAVSPIRRTYDN